jgi:FkbM family methyltransferase
VGDNKKRAFTLFFWFMGLNDPYIAVDRVLTRYSYLRKLKNGKDWILIDCGSHKGKFAESARKHLRLTKVIFIDINKEYNSEIKKKFPKSKIINRAITEKRKVVYMVTNINNPGQNYASSKIKNKNKLNSISLTEIFNLHINNSNAHIFLKMDIEGGEYDVLTFESAETLAKFSCMIIEFHSMQNMLQRRFLQMISAIFEKIYCNFSIAHAHPNNFSGMVKSNGIEIPACIEVTFIRNDLVNKYSSNNKILLPHTLDKQVSQNISELKMPELWWKK